MTIPRFLCGQTVLWRGVSGRVEAHRDTPSGRLVYVSFNVKGKLVVHWIDQSDLSGVTK